MPENVNIFASSVILIFAVILKMANVMNGSEKVTVKALFKFKASNNDEVKKRKQIQFFSSNFSSIIKVEPEKR